jgi:predicted phage terminase large subunit-like protein
MTTMSREELRAFLRRDFVTFVEGSFNQLNPQTEYLHNGHIEVISAALEECRTGMLQRLIINLPPRSLKSHITSVAFPAFLLGHNPSAQIICASYAQALADKLAGDCRSLMMSEWYQGLFPTTRLAARNSALSDFMTTERGFRLSTSVGGVLTGRGADFVIIDDPLKPDEALSETQRKAVNDWYDHTLFSRLNNKNTGCIVLVMQRLHEDDLVGHVLPQAGWRLLKFPAIAEENEHYTIQTPYGERIFTRRQGEALHAQRESLEVLARMRESHGEYNFAGQYQQSPSPLGGGMIKTGWFKTYEPAEMPKKFEVVFQSWDTANKSSELSDFSVCTTWGLREKKLYLLHVLRKRLDYPDLRREVKQQAELWEAKNVVIEDRASGTQLIQDLQADGVYSTTQYEPKMEKILRMHSVSSTIENGFVYIPAEADWLAEYLHEMSSFPNGKYDDQVDSTSQALDWLKEGRECLGLIDWLEQKAVEMGYPGISPTRANGEQSMRKETPSQGRTVRPDSRPCESCNCVMSQVIPNGLRCQQCGAQWLYPGRRPRIGGVNRTGIPNGRGFRPIA